MSTRRFAAILGASTLLIALVGPTFWSRAQVEPGGADPAPARDEFEGKFVGINYKQGDQHTSTLLANVRVRSLTGRAFLVGEFPGGESDVEKGWKGVKSWIPMEFVEHIFLFNDLDQATRLTRRGNE
jgi:hypothetical protein